MNKTIRNSLDWVIPKNIQKVGFDNIKNINLIIKSTNLNSMLKKNKELKGIHKDKRCFILGCSSSINLQDITLLKNETCICLNEFYLHKKYNTLAPKYHLQSPLTIHDEVPHKLRFDYYKDLENRISVDTNLLIDYRDNEFIKSQNLFKNHNIYDFAFLNRLENINSRGIDATKKLYAANSISIMAIQIAIYMGFKEIYLLGIGHDTIIKYVVEFIKENYRDYIKDIDLERLCEHFPWHFYEPGESIMEREGEQNFWEYVDYYRMMKGLVGTLEQYNIINDYAKSQNIKIVNTTIGGILDMFQKVEYKSLFQTH